MARAAKWTIIEAAEIVNVGDLDPASIHVPSIYTNAVVQATSPFLPIEKVMTATSGKPVDAKRRKIASRAAKFLRKGEYVNLGIGLPMLVPNFLPQGVKVIHTPL
ncbi:unnamed protein product [Jaminaea pallidilutea]